MKNAFLTLLILVCSVNLLLADVPKTISYQGKLTDSNGNPVTDGNYKLTFKLTSSPSNSSVIWEESHENVAVTSGLFNVILGSLNPIDLSFNETYYLEVSINDGETLLPLTELTSVPYSLNVSDEAAVKSLNRQTGNLTLRAGDNVSIATNSDTITISSSGNGGGGLTLPFNGAVADDIFAFKVSNTGNGIGILAEAGGPNASVTSINNGEGPAGFFQIANSLDSASVISATTEGVGTVISSLHTGSDGHVATFRATNSNNSESAVSIETENGWTAMQATNNGDGLAAYFLIPNEQSNSIGVLSQNYGNGDAIYGNALGDGFGLRGQSNGTGSALYVANTSGFSKTAEITDNVNNNTEPTLYVTNNTDVLAVPTLKVEPTGRGTGGKFEINNINNGAPAISALHVGNGVAIQGDNKGSGSNAVGVWALSSSSSDGLPFKATQNGTGDNIALFQSQNLNVARIDKTGKGFFNGGTQTGGADLAEAFDVEGSILNYEPGDVLTISLNKDRTVELSHEPYSKLVAGVFATKPGVLLAERNIDSNLSGMVPMGVVGVLPTKVTTENGNIKRGDLLVTSSLPGYAMKGTDQKLMFGATIGKALQDFDRSTGVIRVLVNVK
jgi:hypothetical protein